jgi:toxin ParE1/3/4
LGAKPLSFSLTARSYETLFASGLRGLPFMGYIIFYQIVEDGIEILRIINGSRNLKNVFQTD